MEEGLLRFEARDGFWADAAVGCSGAADETGASGLRVSSTSECVDMLVLPCGGVGCVKTPLLLTIVPDSGAKDLGNLPFYVHLSYCSI